MKEYYQTMKKPDSDQSLFLNKLFEEIMDQVIKANKGHRSLESYILGWSTIEQFLLPELISAIAKRLKVNPPSKMDEIPAATLFKYYYYLSHDKVLYDALEKARKTRNSLVHSLNRHEKWTDINNGFKKAIKDDIAPLYKLIADRYSDHTLIPVLSLYKKGWDDRTKKIEEGFKLLEDIASGNV